MRDVELDVTPEPPPDERDAIAAALTEAAHDGDAGAADAWGRAALREATERDPRP